MIRTLRRQKNDLSFRALQELEDSADLRLIIDDLQQSAKALHDEADNIKTVADGLKKGAEAIDLVVDIVAKLRSFAPLPVWLGRGATLSPNQGCRTGTRSGGNDDRKRGGGGKK